MSMPTRFIATVLIGTTFLLVPFTGSHGDYPAFYLAGHILNSEPGHLYDLALQDKLYHQLIPDAPADQLLFYPSAPFMAIPFQLLALLPYAWSYLSWLGIGAVLALTSFLLLWRACRMSGDWLTALLVSLSFTPLLLEGWVGGQTTALVLFCLASAIYLRSRGHVTWAGIVLAILTFKPTLLLLLVPMLIVTRSFRVLMGMALGGLGLVAVSLWAVGYNGCLRFLHFLTVYAEVKRLAPESLRPWKYVDLQSAMYPVFYHPSLWVSVLLAVLVLVGAVLLLRTWWRATDWRVAWASALIWTPVLSPHFAIYDTVVLIPAALLLVSAGNTLRPWTAIVYVTAWFTQPVAMLFGFQPLTLALSIAGIKCGSNTDQDAKCQDLCQNKGIRPGRNR